MSRLSIAAAALTSVGLASAVLASVAAVAPAQAAVQCASIGSASPNGTPLWTGVLRFVKQTAQCGGSPFFSTGDIARSLYRPYLTSGNNPSAFTHVLGANHVMLITNLNATAQFSGAGTYRNCGISNTVDFSGPVTGGYSFTQTPDVVTASTPTVTLDGFINNYGNIAGCRLYFQGVYVRDPQTIP